MHALVRASAVTARVTTLKGDAIVAEFLGILEEYVASRYRRAPAAVGPAEPVTPC